nr:hypothetical protein Iba_chr07aCG6310 [Ipomoea batatas]
MRIEEGGGNQIIIRGKLNINFSPIKKIIYHRWTKVIPVPPYVNIVEVGTISIHSGFSQIRVKLSSYQIIVRTNICNCLEKVLRTQKNRQRETRGRGFWETVRNRNLTSLRGSNVTDLRQIGGDLRHRGGRCGSRQQQNGDIRGRNRGLGSDVCWRSCGLGSEFLRRRSGLRQQRSSSWRRGSVKGGGVRFDDGTRQWRNSTRLGDVCCRGVRGRNCGLGSDVRSGSMCGSSGARFGQGLRWRSGFRVESRAPQSIVSPTP